METLDLQLALVVAATTGAGLLMIMSGVQKSTLEWKRRRRICPSCGRHVAGRTCHCA